MSTTTRARALLTALLGLLPALVLIGAPPASAAATATTSSSFATTISAGTALGPDQKVCSPNGHCILMQGDGDAFVYAPGAIPVWHTATVNNPGARLVFQTDGNLVVYSRYGKVLWAMNRTARPARLDMQNDGNLVAYNTSGAYWSSFYDPGSDFYVARHFSSSMARGCPDSWEYEVLQRRTETQHLPYPCGFVGQTSSLLRTAPTVHIERDTRSRGAAAQTGDGDGTFWCAWTDPDVTFTLREIIFTPNRGLGNVMGYEGTHLKWCYERGGDIHEIVERSGYFRVQAPFLSAGDVVRDDLRGLGSPKVTWDYSVQIQSCVIKFGCAPKIYPRTTLIADNYGRLSVERHLS